VSAYNKPTELLINGVSVPFQLVGQRAYVHPGDTQAFLQAAQRASQQVAEFDAALNTWINAVEGSGAESPEAADAWASLQAKPLPAGRQPSDYAGVVQQALWRQQRLELEALLQDRGSAGYALSVAALRRFGGVQDAPEDVKLSWVREAVVSRLSRELTANSTSASLEERLAPWWSRMRSELPTQWRSLVRLAGGTPDKLSQRLYQAVLKLAAADETSAGVWSREIEGLRSLGAELTRDQQRAIDELYLKVKQVAADRWAEIDEQGWANRRSVEQAQRFDAEAKALAPFASDAAKALAERIVGGVPLGPASTQVPNAEQLSFIQKLFGISEAGPYGAKTTPKTAALIAALQFTFGRPVDAEVQIGPNTWNDLLQFRQWVNDQRGRAFDPSNETDGRWGLLVSLRNMLSEVGTAERAWEVASEYMSWRDPSLPAKYRALAGFLGMYLESTNPAYLTSPRKPVGSSGGAGSSWLSMPVSNPQLTTEFGVHDSHHESHAGIDLVSSDKTVRAGASGKVVFVGWAEDYGDLMIVDHGNGYLTYYGHLAGFDTAVGDTVAAGDKLGTMGNTGTNTTGPHLHFEVRRGSWNPDIKHKAWAQNAKGITNPWLFLPVQGWNINFRRLIEDAEFTDTSVTKQQIARVLSKAPTFQGRFERFPIYDAAGHGPVGYVNLVDEIYEAAMRYGINPLLLLARMQVEQSLLTQLHDPASPKLQWGLGNGADGSENWDPKYSGLVRQISGAAETLSRWYRSAPDFSQGPVLREGLNQPETVGGKAQERTTSANINDEGHFTIVPNAVGVENKATWALYAYTPHIINLDLPHSTRVATPEFPDTYKNPDPATEVGGGNKVFVESWNLVKGWLG